MYGVFIFIIKNNCFCSILCKYLNVNLLNFIILLNLIFTSISFSKRHIEAVFP